MWAVSTAGRLQFQAVDTSGLPCRHQPRQIHRIGEEGEDATYREGNPLFGRKRESLLSRLLLDPIPSANHCRIARHTESVDGIREPLALRLRFH
jgi:hypothetical protein